eukprot:scaffold10292_cov119-Skeletonema_dohrnii-CCMP3373.AAC.5
MTTSTESIASTATQISRSEEAHWSSFRGEVLQLQQSLVASLFDNDNGCTSSTKSVKKSRDKNTSRKGNEANYSSQADSMTKTNGKQLKAPANANDTQLHHGVTKENKLPQSQLQLSPLEELDDNSEFINNESDDSNFNYNATQSHHHYLELIGMEEVDRSICSVNNKHNLSSHDNNNVPTNNNALSHASQNTNALSIATQELAELKLKLALTESQKDELEFELMQSRHDSSDVA